MQIPKSPPPTIIQYVPRCHECFWQLPLFLELCGKVLLATICSKFRCRKIQKQSREKYFSVYRASHLSDTLGAYQEPPTFRNQPQDVTKKLIFFSFFFSFDMKEGFR